MILSGSKLGVCGSLERDEVVSATGMRWRNDVKNVRRRTRIHVGVCNCKVVADADAVANSVRMRNKHNPNVGVVVERIP